MASVPLFNSYDDLKKACRLTSATQVGTLATFDRVIIDVRLGFLSRLGASRVSEIKGTAYTAEPETESQIARARANVVEMKWCKALLIAELPMLFMDDSSKQDQIWNEEPLTRDAGNRSVQELAAKLMVEVEDGLALLLGSTAASNARVAVIGPTTRQPRPGESVRLGGNFC